MHVQTNVSVPDILKLNGLFKILVEFIAVTFSLDFVLYTGLGQPPPKKFCVSGNPTDPIKFTEVKDLERFSFTTTIKRCIHTKEKCYDLN